MIREALLTPNASIRPQYRMRRVDAIVLHWVGNPGTSAEQNRRYFESLKDTTLKASAHYIIDAKEIVRCVPEDEVAYHCGSQTGYTPWATERWHGEHANWYCLGVEHCHPDWSGVWAPEVEWWSQLLVAGLCVQYGLKVEDIILHWTVTGKECPRHMVADPWRLTAYRERVRALMHGSRPDPEALYAGPGLMEG